MKTSFVKDCYYYSSYKSIYKYQGGCKFLDCHSNNIIIFNNLIVYKKGETGFYDYEIFENSETNERIRNTSILTPVFAEFLLGKSIDIEEFLIKFNLQESEFNEILNFIYERINLEILKYKYSKM